jgi:hypothetical protein
MMNDKELYNTLEKAFIATFLDELLPGIFHNFANPLNGIMGRSKLMQRRLADFVKKLEGKYPGIEEEMGTEYKKLLSDINSINNESERFFDMFQVSTAKFYTIGSHSIEKLSLSNLIEQEIAFADFYLDFKHNIMKEIQLDKNIPYISGIASFYSMSIWMLMRYAMSHIRTGNDKTFFMKTGYDDQFVIANIAIPIDSHLFKTWQKMPTKLYNDLSNLSDFTVEQEKLIFAMSLLQQASDGVQINHDETAEMLTVKIPYRK